MKDWRFKHGHSRGGKHSRTYIAWNNMVSRCRYANLPDWPRYGGRGIRVCERWQTFANFLADMGEAPAGLSIERENNDGDYEPNNCKWATPMDQGANTCRNRLITIDGRTQHLRAWAREAGRSHATIRQRLRRGLEPRLAVFAPPQPAILNLKRATPC